MTQKDNGGPAFPRESYDPETDMDGLTLRDYFAGQALAGLFAGSDPDQAVPPPAEDWAKISYLLADAMLAERSK